MTCNASKELQVQSFTSPKFPGLGIVFKGECCLVPNQWSEEKMGHRTYVTFRRFAIDNDNGCAIHIDVDVDCQEKSKMAVSKSEGVASPRLKQTYR
jgi:hypothetical protein